MLGFNIRMEVNACERKRASTGTQELTSRFVPRSLISASSKRTRLRLLNAAAEVLSRKGLYGATTREIARRAGVSEVTLFRHFERKERLLYALVEHWVASRIAVLEKNASWTANLLKSMDEYAREWYPDFAEGECAGAFLVEELFWPERMRVAMAEIIRPLRERLVALLADAQEAGAIRTDLKVACALDAFNSALYGGALHPASCRTPKYAHNVYRRTVVAIFMRGIGAFN